MGSPLERRDAFFIVLAALGILSFRLSAWSVFGNEFASVADSVYTYSRLAQAVGVIALIALSLGNRLRSIDLWRRLVPFAAALMSASCILCLWSVDPSDPGFVSGRVFHGVGSAVLIIGWGSYSCAVEPKKSVLAATLAFSMYGVALPLLSNIPSWAIDVCALAFPLVSGGLLIYLGSRAEAPEEALSLKGAPFPRLLETPWSVLVLLELCALACTATELVVAPTGGESRMFSENLVRGPVFVAVFLVVVVWVFLLKKDNPDQLWGLYGMVMGTGLLCFSSFNLLNFAASAAVLRSTQDCMMLFTWMFVSGLVYREKLPRIAFFGLGSLMFLQTTIPADIPRVLSLAFPQPDPVLATVVAFTMGIVLVASTLFLAIQANRKDAVTDPQGVVCDTVWLEDAYGLSEREAEVARYICEGNTLPQTADALSISLNTVRSHAKSIYTKLGIHSKGELMELVGTHLGRVL